MYDAPRTLFYRAKGGTWPQSRTTYGETSRSYLVGPRFPPNRLQKATIDLISEEEYRNARFVVDHRHKIGRLVMDLKDPAILRQIAALVGFEEKPNA